MAIQFARSICFSFQWPRVPVREQRKCLDFQLEKTPSMGITNNLPVVSESQCEMRDRIRSSVCLYVVVVVVILNQKWIFRKVQPCDRVNRVNYIQKPRYSGTVKTNRHAFVWTIFRFISNFRWNTTIRQRQARICRRHQCTLHWMILQKV